MVGINPQTKPGPPCERCGWPYPAFHVCIDMNDPKVREISLTPAQRVLNQQNRYTRFSETPETRARKREAATRQWAAHHKKNACRDAEIVRLYDEQMLTYRELAAKFGIDQRTVAAVLHRAADDGEIVIRPAQRRSSLI